MTGAGWIIMLISWATIAGLTGFALWKTAMTGRDDFAAPLDIEAEIEEKEKAKKEER